MVLRVVLFSINLVWVAAAIASEVQLMQRIETSLGGVLPGYSILAQFVLVAAFGLITRTPILLPIASLGCELLALGYSTLGYIALPLNTALGREYYYLDIIAIAALCLVNLWWAWVERKAMPPRNP